MDSASRDDLIRYSLGILSSVTPHEIDRNRAPLKQIILPLAKQLSPRETAGSVLSLVVEGIPGNERFLKEIRDPTGIILGVLGTAVGPKKVFLSGGDDLLSSFMRALITRYFVGDFTVRRQWKGLRYGIATYLREEGLSDSTSTNATKNGLKVYDVETVLNAPGIWIFLAKALPRLPHLPQEEMDQMIQRLVEGEYPEIISFARKWEKLWILCLRLVTKYIRKLDSAQP